MTVSRYRVEGDVRFRPMSGETVVVRQEAGEVLVLNELGGHLLELVHRGLDEQELVAHVLEDFEVDEETAREDTRDFLETLREAGVLRRAERGG